VAALARAFDERFAGLVRTLQRHTSRELGRTAVSVLGALRDGGPRRITELAGAEAVTQPTMTTVVGRLDRDGLVRRVPDPADRRAVLVEILPKGLDALARYSAARHATLERALRALDAKERAAIAAALPAIDRLIVELAKEHR
jgi:DNA-binding MarR family transcriptional regulator